MVFLFAGGVVLFAVLFIASFVPPFVDAVTPAAPRTEVVACSSVSASAICSSDVPGGVSISK